MTEANILKARLAFVVIIKEENFYSDGHKQSLKAHWTGKPRGFADDNLQRRWHDFLLGYEAASKLPEGIE